MQSTKEFRDEIAKEIEMVRDLSVRYLGINSMSYTSTSVNITTDCLSYPHLLLVVDIYTNEEISKDHIRNLTLLIHSIIYITEDVVVRNNDERSEWSAKQYISRGMEGE